MAMKMNVGVSRKIDMPNYGSICASCGLDFEVESALLQGDLAAFQKQVSRAYDACRQAVQQELARQQADTGTSPSDGIANAEVPGELGPAFLSPPTNGNGSQRNGGNGSNGHSATEKQLAYARQLAKQVPGLGVRRLEALANRMYGKPVAGLTSFDASGLIDTLKAVKAGDVDIEQVLNGAPA
jgi:hypothetical protein